MSVDQAHGLRSLLSGQARAHQSDGRRTRVLAVTSGKGGVGKTQVSVCLAVVAARRGLRALLVDADVGLANADVMLGARPQLTIEDVLAGRCSTAEALARGAEGVSLLTVGCGAILRARSPAAQRDALRSLVRSVPGAFDVIVIDCGAGVGDTVVAFAGVADERLIVVTPEPTALVDAYAMAKAISDAGHASAEVVVNCANTQTEAESCFRKLEAVTGRFLPLALRFAGSIPRDDAVRRAVMRRRSVVVDAPLSRVSQALAQLGERFRFGAACEPDSMVPS